jgi:hypothetical protein
MPLYDTAQFEPPAPVAQVVLRNPANGAKASDVEMLIDSGADATFLPLALLAKLKLEPLAGQEYEVVGFDGTRSFAPAAELELDWHDVTFRGRYLLVDAKWGILGRDVLNHLSLLLNGPKLEWTLPVA